MADEKKKLAGKYETVDDLVKAYEAMESKLGEQGKALGDFGKKEQEYQSQLQQAAAYVQNLQAQYAQQMQAVQQQGRAGAQQAGMQAVQQAGAQAASVGHILTQDEQNYIYNNAARFFIENVHTPWARQFEQGAVQFAHKLAQEVRSDASNQVKAAVELLHHAITEIAPPDKAELLKNLHQTALEYSDPSKYDPMKFAKEKQSHISELATLKARAAELEKSLEEAQRASVPAPAGVGASPFKVDDTAAPQSREDRMARVLNQTRESVGADGFRAAFPAAR